MHWASGGEEIKQTKVRKQNFSLSEIALLTEKLQENFSLIQSKLTNSITNKHKIQIWKKITDTVNAVSVVNCTVQEVQDKLKNLQSIAKEFLSFRWETAKNGGGPAPKPPSLATEKSIEIFKETPSFTGLQGF